MAFRVTQYGEPVLRAKGEPVTRFDDALARFADEMVATMYAAEGIGLAAQQVGKPLQLCVVDVRPPDGEVAPFHYVLDGRQPPLELVMPIALANPRVSIIDPSEVPYEEGCLSFPEVQGNVLRPAAIRVDFQDVRGNPHSLSCDGLLARCVLHEVDHLEGVLFIDRMDKRDLRRVENKIKRIKRESRDFLKQQREGSSNVSR